MFSTRITIVAAARRWRRITLCVELLAFACQSTIAAADPAVVHIPGTIGFGPNSTLEFELAGASAGPPTDFDRLIVDGTATLAGKLDVLLIDGFESSISSSDQFTILDAATLQGNFSNTGPGERLLIEEHAAYVTVDYGPTSPFGANQVVLSDYALATLETVTWDGAQANWLDALHWSPNVSPNNDGESIYHAIVASGSPMVTTPINVSTFTVEGGSANISSQLTTTNLEYSGGNLEGAGSLIVTGTGMISGQDAKRISVQVFNQGDLIWNGSAFGSGGGTIHNQGQFTIDVTTDLPLGVVLMNATGSTVTHQSGATVTTGSVVNDGLVEITGGGTLRVGGAAGASNGEFLVADGVLDFTSNSNHQYFGPISGQQVVHSGNSTVRGEYDVATTIISGGNSMFNTPSLARTDTLRVMGGTSLAAGTQMTTPNLEFLIGDINGAGSLTVTGAATLSGPDFKRAGALIINQGEFLWTDGPVSGGGTLRNEGHVTIDVPTARPFGLVVNNTPGSTVTHQSGATVATNSMMNDGLVEITGGGTLEIGGGFAASNGEYVVVDGALNLTSNSNPQYRGRISGDQVIHSGNAVISGQYDVDTTIINGGFSTFSTPTIVKTNLLRVMGNTNLASGTQMMTTNLEYLSGSLGGSGQLTVTSTGTFSGAASKSAAVQIINQGEMAWTDGPLTGGGMLRNEGVFDIALATDQNFSLQLINAPGATLIRTTPGSTTFGNNSTNQGVFEIRAGQLVFNSAQLTNHNGTTLSGGEWIVEDGAALSFNGATVATNSARVVLRGPASSFAAMDALANNQGTFEIHDGRDFTTIGDLSNSGAIVVGDLSTLSVTGAYLPAGDSTTHVDGTLIVPGGVGAANGDVVAGAGIIQGNVDIQSAGVVAPGNRAGTLTVQGNLGLADGAIYEWGIETGGGAENRDLLAVSGDLLITDPVAQIDLRIVDEGGDVAGEHPLIEYTGADPVVQAAWSVEFIPNSQIHYTGPSGSWDDVGNWDGRQLSGGAVSYQPNNNRVVLSGVNATSIGPQPEVEVIIESMDEEVVVEGPAADETVEAVQIGGFGSGNIIVLMPETGRLKVKEEVKVEERGKLGGTGEIDGRVRIGPLGRISPGRSPGTLTTGDLIFENSAIYQWELDEFGASDAIVVNGTLSFNETATLELVDLGGAPDPLAEYVLFSYTPTFNDPILPEWIIDSSLAPNWDASSASIVVDAQSNRILLTGLDVASSSGDFDGNELVDGADFLVWQRGGSPSPISPSDLGDWEANFGTSLLDAAQSQIPEPASALLLLLGSALAARSWLGRRRMHCATPLLAEATS